VAIFIFIVFVFFGQQQQQQRNGSTTIVKNSRINEKTIGDNYKTYAELQEGLRQAGLESSNLIIGVDFTKSNLWTGQKTFGGNSLHAIVPNCLNPYQTVINILGKTLGSFDDDNQIPVYGFGDITTIDKRVFPFIPDRPCNGFEEALECYNVIAPSVELSGPTSFAPIIREAIRIVQKQKSYHILIIIADGQVTNLKETVAAIIDCSHYPISIILVGVGDGPWDNMEEFDDALPERQFDNFQFVNFHDIMVKYDGDELIFAREALMEIPDQFKAIKKLNLLSSFSK